MANATTQTDTGTAITVEATGKQVVIATDTGIVIEQASAPVSNVLATH